MTHARFSGRKSFAATITPTDPDTPNAHSMSILGTAVRFLCLLAAFPACALGRQADVGQPASRPLEVEKPQHIAVVGAGFSGLTASLELAKLGYQVTLFDKHAEPGGRARTFTSEGGFTFDYGPSWYWMP